MVYYFHIDPLKPASDQQLSEINTVDQSFTAQYFIKATVPNGTKLQERDQLKEKYLGMCDNMYDDRS